MRLVRFGALATGLLLLSLLLFISPATSFAGPHSQESPPRSPDLVAGAASYAENCAPCHGQTGDGDGPSAAGLGVPPTALGDYDTIADLSLAQMFDITKNGRMDRMMPPWRNRLNDQEIWDTIGYAWTLHTSPAEISTGQIVYEASCAMCHGVDGQGGESSILDFTDLAATATIAQSTWSGVLREGRGEMPAFGNQLDEPARQAVLEYLRSLSFGPASDQQAPQRALESGVGVITGQVTNRTTGDFVSGVNVDLGVFSTSAVLDQRSTTTDESGIYSFTELPTDPDLIFITRTEFPEGFPYSSEPISFAEGQTELELNVAVFESTSDSAGVSVDRVHYIIEIEAGHLMVAELVVFSLDGDRTYIGEGDGVLELTLPAGAQSLEINDGELGARFVSTANGFLDTLPLPPGQGVRQLLYRYILPITDDSLELVRSIPYPASNVNALVADVGGKVTSDQLIEEGKRTTEMGSYTNLTGTDIPANQQITIKLTGLPKPGATATSSVTSNRALLFILIGLAGLVAALLIAWPILRKRQPGLARIRGGESQDALRDALTDLDIAFQDGEIDEIGYREERLRLKTRLLDASQPGSSEGEDSVV